MEPETNHDKSVTKKFYALCLHDFDAGSASELTIREGDLLRILRAGESGWWCAKSRQGRGWVPSVFVHKIADDSVEMIRSLGEELNFLSAPPREKKKGAREHYVSPPPAMRMDRHPYAMAGVESNDMAEVVEEYQTFSSYIKRRIRNDDESTNGKNQLPKLVTVTRFIRHITCLPPTSEESKQLQHALLSTYHLYMSAEGLLDLLVAIYNVRMPSELISKMVIADWETEVQGPTQSIILGILENWISKYHLLEDAPHLVPVIFSCLNAASLRFGRDHIRRSMEKILLKPIEPEQSSFRALRRKWNGFKTHPVDGREFAEQLTYYESRLFRAIRPRELLEWLKCRTSNGVQTLSKFVATCDRLAAWVKESILMEVEIERRAEAVQRWITVASTCYTLNNFSSTFAIVAALCSANIERLTRTWGYVADRMRLMELHETISVERNFRVYRSLLKSVNGPCVPFIGTHLRDMVHISDAYGSTVTRPAAVGEAEGQTEINLRKCCKLVETMDSALRHQTENYDIQGSPRLLTYIESRLRRQYPDDIWFDRRCKEILALESRASLQDRHEAS